MAKSNKTSKRLYRSCDNKILAGVCSGIGEYTNIDPNIIRLLWILLTLISLGIGILVYIAAWILVPCDPKCKCKPCC